MKKQRVFEGFARNRGGAVAKLRIKKEDLKRGWDLLRGVD